MGSPFTRPRRSGIASPGGDTPGASIGDANTRLQIAADPRLLVPTLDGPRATPLGTTTTITDTPGVRPMIGYVVIRGIGRDGFGSWGIGTSQAYEEQTKRAERAQHTPTSLKTYLCGC